MFPSSSRIKLVDKPSYLPPTAEKVGLYLNFATLTIVQSCPFAFVPSVAFEIVESQKFAGFTRFGIFQHWRLKSTFQLETYEAPTENLSRWRSKKHKFDLFVSREKTSMKIAKKKLQ